MLKARHGAHNAGDSQVEGEIHGGTGSRDFNIVLHHLYGLLL